jgi:hypothetical protein
MLKLRTVLTVLLLLLIVGAATGRLAAAPLPQDNQYFISYPTEGAMVSGAVEIIGTVTHPNFDSYGVLYAPGAGPTADSQWVQIVFGAGEQVSNGVLAVWDTAAFTEDGQPLVPNGVYTLALARYRGGSTEPDLQFIRNITVNNIDVTPTPAEPTSTPEAMPTAAVATPTSVPVEQPPTATPRPSAVPGSDETPEAGPGEGNEEEGDGGVELPIDPGQLRGAFFEGARITLLLFVLWGVYVLLKAGVRYLMRRGLLDIDVPLPWRKK